MSYQETLDYLYSQLPMFQRIGPAAYKASLDNILALSHHLGHPEKSFRSIHIAGTNGKGSVAHMMASVMQEQGYKTGLATSPHLKDFRERIKVNGDLIPKSEVIRFVSEHKTLFERIKPSFFEMTMAMTFDWFARQKTDIAVIETGMGGRLDSSNIITPELSVITNIGYDHAQFLGHELPLIAKEKAGIIKPGVPVIIGKRQPEVQEVFDRTAARLKAPLSMAGDLFAVMDHRTEVKNGSPCLWVSTLHRGNLSGYCLGLHGLYQLDNMITVLASFDVLNRSGKLLVGNDAIRRGLLHVVKNTGLKGRWQRIGKRPLIICDAGHNEDGIKQAMQQLAGIPRNKLLVVFGMVDDKNRAAILKQLSAEASYYFCKPHVPRGLDAKMLAKDASIRGLCGKVYDSVAEALNAAKKDASANDLIFVGGSTFVVAEVL